MVSVRGPGVSPLLPNGLWGPACWSQMRTPEESTKHRDTWSWQRPVGSGRRRPFPRLTFRGSPMNRGARVSMAAFVAGLARPYRAWIVIILLAMLAETLTAPALPWPLTRGQRRRHRGEARHRTQGCARASLTGFWSHEDMYFSPPL